MSTALLDRQVAIRTEGERRWEIVAASDARARAFQASLVEDSAEVRLAALKAKARRRAATMPRYPDSDDTASNVLDMKPLQLRVMADRDD